MDWNLEVFRIEWIVIWMFIQLDGLLFGYFSNWVDYTLDVFLVN